jgi:oligopeptidase A
MQESTNLNNKTQTTTFKSVIFNSQHNIIKYIDFSNLSTTHLEHQLSAKFDKISNLIKSIENNNLQGQENPPKRQFENIFLPVYNEIFELNNSWGLINHLVSVVSSDELRQLQHKWEPIISNFFIELGQSYSLYNTYKAIKKSEFNELSIEQQKVLDNELRDFFLSGVGLSTKKQELFKSVQLKLTKLSTQSEHNVLDSTDAYAKYVTKDELDGLPDSYLTLYHEQAKQDGKNDGLYKITLHIPCYLPIMQYCTNRKLREELYYNYVTKASELAPNPKFNNSKIISDILKLRQQKASLLEFDNYSQLSLYTKMAENSQQVSLFLEKIAAHYKPKAVKELEELKEFAKQIGFNEAIQPWDMPFFSEKLRISKFAYSSEEIRQYFPLEQVMQGLFTLINKLYDIEFRENTKVTTWHQQVKCFDVLLNGKDIATIYLDLYARNKKQSGAWMNSAQDRHLNTIYNKVYLPIAYVVCNFTAPTQSGTSVLLTFEEVQTLFHEMGHALHHILTNNTNYSISGINGVEWDAVELPSQFMEFFAWDYSIISLISQHVKTKESLPKDLFIKLTNARFFQSGLQTIRQIEFALFDLEIHCSQNNDNQDIDYNEILNQIRNKVCVVIPPSFNRFAQSFSHIFAGGYACGYYSYKWAEVLAADAFGNFNGVKLDKLKHIGNKFKTTILQVGGLYPTTQNFRNFMGREVNPDALFDLENELPNIF